MHSLCHVDVIDPKTGKEALIQTDAGNRYIALFKVNDEVRAYLNTCPHQGRSLNWAPDQFLLGDDGNLVCPHHGACFKLGSGECVSGPCEGATLTAVEIEVIEGTVFLKDPA